MSDWRIIWGQARNAKEEFVSSDNFTLFEYLLKNHPYDGMVYYMLGEAYETKDDTQKALDAYSKALSFFPMPKWKYQAQIAINRITGKNQDITITRNKKKSDPNSIYYDDGEVIF